MYSTPQYEEPFQSSDLFDFLVFLVESSIIVLVRNVRGKIAKSNKSDLWNGSIRHTEVCLTFSRLAANFSELAGVI